MPDPTKRKADVAIRICELIHGRGEMTAQEISEETGFSMTMTHSYMRHAVENGAGDYSVERRVDETTHRITWRVSKASKSRKVMMHSLATTKPMSLTGGRYA